MSKIKKIAICGVHGVGKTTICKKVYTSIIKDKAIIELKDRNLLKYMKKIILIIILLGLLISCREKNYCIKNQEFFRRVQDYCNCKCQFEYKLQRFNKDKSDKVL